MAEPTRPPARTVSLRRALRRAVVPGVVGILLAMAIRSLVILVLAVGLHPQLIQLERAADAARDAHDAMLEERAALRAFLATGDETFLTPYLDGVQRVAAADDDLVVALGREGELLPEFLALTERQRAWHEGWAAPAVERVRAEGVGSIDELSVALLDGDRVFAAYQDADARLRQDIATQLDAGTGRFWAVLGLSTVAVLLVGLLSIVALSWGRRRVARQVVAPVSELTAAVERVARGDLSGRVATASPVRELRGLAAGVSAMTSALAERAQTATDREQELVRRSDRLHHVLDLSRELSESLSLRYTSSRLIGAVEELSGAVRVELWLHQHERHVLVRYDPDGADAGVALDVAELVGDDATGAADAVEVGVGAVGRAARYGRAIPLDERRAAGGLDLPQRGVAIPMVIGARVIGVLTLEAAQGTYLDLDLLDAFILQGASALQAARLHGEVEERSRRDALTGLGNRRQFDADLATNVARAARYRRPLALALIDLDHFKRINDTYGHARGDEVLQDVAGLVVEEIRDVDTAYRYGGEELCVLMPETDEADAAEVVERLRRRVAESFAWATDPTVTLSVGVAELGDDADSAALLEEADRALYEAKRAGRNRVERAAAAPVA
ncbi:diguanylate cyclase [Nocardioides sp. GY 10113]|uniref:diguanylate cyclase n=1 Tax=Nocardioides sp. GY 10113 TaxID=2569761 RepID=UPI0010A90F7D|nr:diguanylate cyclase [Nocardioides sp. GY 10113]TIC84801.1 diguanylate cyclase [Nocardioides sp. GY 10113]